MNKEFNTYRKLINYDASQNKSLTMSEVFSVAQDKLGNRDIVGFGKDILAMYSQMHCNCFFREIDTSVYSEMLAIVTSPPAIKEWSTNVYHTIGMSFIFYWNKRSFHSLREGTFYDDTDALELYKMFTRDNNNDWDVCGNEYYDKLNSAKGYYYLAYKYANNVNCRLKEYISSEYNKDFKNAVHYYTKAFELDTSFQCAYYRKALLHVHLFEIEKAITHFNECISIEIKQWQYLEFSYNLLVRGFFNEALDYSTSGYILFPKELKFHYLITSSYLGLGMYKEAIVQLYSSGKSFSEDKNLYTLQIFKYVTNPETYLNTIPKATEEIILNTIDELAVNLLSFKKYGDVQSLYKCIHQVIDNTYQSWNYLYAILMEYDDSIQIDKENSLYKEFEILVKKGNESTDDDDVKIRNNYKTILDLRQFNQSSKFLFGKHNGKTVGKVLKEEPSYIIWVSRNVDSIFFESTIYKNYTFELNNAFYKALEYNCIKQLIYNDFIYYDGIDEEYSISYYNDWPHNSRQNEINRFYALTDGNHGDYHDYE